MLDPTAADHMRNVDLIGELQRLLQVLPMVQYQRDLIALAIVRLSEREGTRC
jgi:hypothetical protein